MPVCRLSSTNPRTPSGAPAATSASWATAMMASDSCGWPGLGLTTTGQPEANADAVSPPRVENANGKLLAANTATGPRGMFIRRRSGRGGVSDGSAWSITTPRNAPSRTTFAMRRNCPVVRPTSPRSRSSPSRLSVIAIGTSSSIFASTASAIASSSPALVDRSVAANHGAASRAWAHAASTLATRVAPVCGHGDLALPFVVHVCRTSAGFSDACRCSAGDAGTDDRVLPPHSHALEHPRTGQLEFRVTRSVRSAEMSSAVIRPSLMGITTSPASRSAASRSSTATKERATSSPGSSRPVGECPPIAIAVTSWPGIGEHRCRRGRRAHDDVGLARVLLPTRSMRPPR